MNSRFLSEPQVDLFVRNYDDPDGLRESYALAKFAERARYGHEYAANPGWEAAVALSPEGSNFFAKCMPTGAAFTTSDLKMALFGRFVWNGLLVDPKNSDLSWIFQTLSDELVASKVRLPAGFGRLLYDRFNDLHPEGTIIRLPEDQVWSLLDGIPQGVSQIGCTLTGPFGLLRSRQARYLPPTRPVLWHTRHRGSLIAYPVEFTPPDIGIVRAYTALETEAVRSDVPQSEWHYPLARSCCANDLDDFHDIPILVAEAVLGAERTALLARALETAAGASIREVLSGPGRRAGLAKGTPTDLASRLSPEEQLQLLLVLPDATLVALLDECCKTRRIKIAANEVRRAHTPAPSLDPESEGTPSELSGLGVRHAPENPTVRLITLVEAAYRESDGAAELAWKLRTRSSSSPFADLSAFVRREGAAAAIQRLVLSSRPVAAYVMEKLGVNPSDRTDAELERLLLWKCGFNLPQFTSVLSDLRSQLREFQETVIALPDVESESARSVIRKVGVNLFVSFEQFLEAIISYNVWLFVSDHHADTHFVYRPSDALRTVPPVFGSRLKDAEVSPWDAGGHNTLGTLLTYLNLLGKWLQELGETGRAEHARHPGTLPPTARLRSKRFPFRHTQLWADCSAPELQRHATTLNEIARLLAKADLAGVRNAVNHKREEGEFPSIDRLLSFVAYAMQALERAESTRAFPKEYWIQRSSTNADGQRVFELIDHRNITLELYSPSPLYGLHRNSILAAGRTVVVAPESLLGAPDSELCFVVGCDSPYFRHWKGYPRLRTVDSPPSASGAESVQTSEQA